MNEQCLFGQMMLEFQLCGEWLVREIGHHRRLFLVVDLAVSEDTEGCRTPLQNAGYLAGMGSACDVHSSDIDQNIEYPWKQDLFFHGLPGDDTENLCKVLSFQQVSCSDRI